MEYETAWNTVRHEVLHDIPSGWVIEEEDAEDGYLLTQWKVRNAISRVLRSRVEATLDSTAEGQVIRIRVIRERVFPSFTYHVDNPEGNDWDSFAPDENAANNLMLSIGMELSD